MCAILNSLFHFLCPLSSLSFSTRSYPLISHVTATHEGRRNLLSPHTRHSHEERVGGSDEVEHGGDEAELEGTLDDDGGRVTEGEAEDDVPRTREADRGDGLLWRTGLCGRRVGGDAGARGLSSREAVCVWVWGGGRRGKGGMGQVQVSVSARYSQLALCLIRR